MLAAQKPAWPPGTRHGYHGITLGWYESELIRRTDPAGRTLGRFFADEIAGPLGLDLHIGLPDSVADDRVARCTTGRARNPSAPQRDTARTCWPHHSIQLGLLARAAALPRDVVPWTGDYNRDDVRAIEIPSANGIGTARAVAQLYGATATGEAALGLTRPVLKSSWPSRPHRAADSGTRYCASTPSFRWDCQSRHRLCVFGSSDKSLRHTRFRRLVRLRRPRHRSRLRLRDEPDGFPPVQRSTRTRGSAKHCSATCSAHDRRSSEPTARWPSHPPR